MKKEIRTKQVALKKDEKKGGKRIQFDISRYDRTSIIWKIRSAYRMGYTTIMLHYNNLSTAHLRKDDKLLVRDAIRDQIGKTLGGRAEIVDDHNAIIYVDFVAGDVEEILKRLLHKLVDMHSEFILLLRGHLYAASLIDEKHDTLTKLVAYAQLLLTRTDHDTAATVKFHFLAMIDKIADIIKYMARDYLKAERPMSKTGLAIATSTHEYLVFYERVHLRFHTPDVLQLVLKRDDIKRYMRDSAKGLISTEAFILGQETCIVELIVDLLESRMSLELK